MEVSIEKYRAEDLDELIHLFRETVHTVNAGDYTEDQLEAWAPEKMDSDLWKRRLKRNYSMVARCRGQIVGFAVLSPAANVEMLFVHKNFQLEKVGSELISKIEENAVQEGMTLLTTQSSITAKPFFEKMGFKTVEKLQQSLRGVDLISYSMKKDLPA